MIKTKFKLINDDVNCEDKIEKKHIDYLAESCNKIIQQCSRKDFKVAELKWQPHYTTVFKQIKMILEQILEKDSTKNLEKLNENSYLLNMKNELFKSFSGFSKYLQENGANIGNLESMHRKNFFQQIVHYQFLVLELQEYFPGGNFRPDALKISKAEARTWWTENFPNEMFVDRQRFMGKLREKFNLANQGEIISFENCIDFSKTKFVTTFEFDIITRLYAPWESFIEVWRIIFNHPGYLHFSTYGETKEILGKHTAKPGTYVFRVSCKDLGCWTIGYIKASSEMGQIKVDRSNLLEALVEGKQKKIYLYPNGEDLDRDVSRFINYRKELVVNPEDLSLYASFDDFKECKICREAEKNLQIESCGHQICDVCFKQLMRFNKKLCPFCNQSIKSTTKIVNKRTECVPSSPYTDMNSGGLHSPTDKSVYVEGNIPRKVSCVTSEENTPPVPPLPAYVICSGGSGDSNRPPPVPPAPNKPSKPVNKFNYPPINNSDQTSSLAHKTADDMYTTMTGGATAAVDPKPNSKAPVPPPLFKSQKPLPGQRWSGNSQKPPTPPPLPSQLTNQSIYMNAGTPQPAAPPQSNNNSEYMNCGPPQPPLPGTMYGPANSRVVPSPTGPISPPLPAPPPNNSEYMKASVPVLPPLPSSLSTMISNSEYLSPNNQQHQLLRGPGAAMFPNSASESIARAFNEFAGYNTNQLNVNSGSAADGQLMKPAVSTEDVYSEPLDEHGQPLLPAQTIQQPSTPNLQPHQLPQPTVPEADIYYLPCEVQSTVFGNESNDCDLVEYSDNVESNDNQPEPEIQKQTHQTQPEAPPQDDEEDSSFDKLFVGWTQHNIIRAMTVSKGDIQLAKAILEEFVPKKLKNGS